MTALVQKSTPAVYVRSLTGQASSISITGGNAVIALVVHNNFSGNGAGTTVAEGATNYQLALRQTGYGATSGSFSIEWYVLFNAAAGAHAPVATSVAGTAANSYGQIQTWEVSGLSGNIDPASLGAIGNNTTPSVATAALAQAANFAIAMYANTGVSTAGITNPPTGGWTSQYADSNTADPPCYLSDQITAATTALSAAWGTLTTGSKWAAGIVVFEAMAGGTPTITSVNTNNTVSPGATGLLIAGTNFTNSTGNTVTITAGGATVGQTLTAQTTTQLTMTCVQGNLPYGAATLTVTNALGLVATIAITIVPASGVSAWNLGTLAALTFDSLGKPSVIYDASTEFGTQLIPNNAIVESSITGGSGVYQIDADGRLSWTFTVTQIQHRYWQPTLFWSSMSTWDLRAPFPVATGAIPAQSFTNGVAIPAIAGAVYFSIPDATGGNVLTFSLSANPGWESVGSSTGSITGTPSANGTTDPVLTGTDSYGSAVSLPPFIQVVNASIQGVSFNGTGWPSTLSGTSTQPFANFDVSSFFPNATSYSVSGLAGSGLSLTGSVLGGATPVAGNYTAIVTGSNSLPSAAPSTAIAISIANGLLTGIVPALQGQGNLTEAFCSNALQAVGLVGLFPIDWLGALPVVQNIAAGTALNVGSQVTVSLLGTGFVQGSSQQIQNLAAVPVELNLSYLSGSGLIDCLDECDLGGADQAGSNYRYFRIPSGVRVVNVEGQWDSNPSGSQYSIGVLDIKGGGTPSVAGNPITGSNAIFANGVSIDATQTTWVSIFKPAIAGQAASISALKLRVWELLGYATDPNKMFDVALFATVPGQAGGRVLLRLTYVQ